MQAKKVYVQDRLRESGDLVWGLLEGGGHFYVCGDAAHMAGAVERALVQIIVSHQVCRKACNILNSPVQTGYAFDCDYRMQMFKCKLHQWGTQWGQGSASCGSQKAAHCSVRERPTAQLGHPALPRQVCYVNGMAAAAAPREAGQQLRQEHAKRNTEGMEVTLKRLSFTRNACVLSQVAHSMLSGAEPLSTGRDKERRLLPSIFRIWRRDSDTREMCGSESGFKDWFHERIL